ncbi:MAG: cation diffusion facilitator family transporter [Anaerorhabdus sp.]
MTQWLMKKFIKDYENVQDAQVRSHYGILSSVIGIVINLGLVAVKTSLGVLTGSISILSDAVNNLSDMANSIVTLFGYKMAAKPADEGHPFGHGRIEYLSSLFVAVVILMLGIELLKISIDKTIHPTSLEVNGFILLVLFITILVKVWVYLFNKKLGNKTNNRVLLATAADSLNDVLATTVTLVAALSAMLWGMTLDGIMGIFVSLFILYSGINIVRDTVDEIIGKPVSIELIEEIEKTILSYSEILGIHDLLIHEYGPGKYIGSAHVELNAKSNFIDAHQLVDEIESELEHNIHIVMTLHMDPIESDNKIVDAYRTQVKEVIESIDDKFQVNDFRMVVCENSTNLIFDVVVPFEKKISFDELKQVIDETLQANQNKIKTIIKFKRG